MWVFCMDRECECRVLVYLNIVLIRFLKFTEDHKLQLHLSRKELFGVGPVVHKGVQLLFAINSVGSIKGDTNGKNK